MLLDLRAHLLQGDDWEETLDLFLACRERLEAEHYLPFYRLRRLIANSLKLEAGTSQARRRCAKYFAGSIARLLISSAH